jgi:signal peptidase I
MDSTIIFYLVVLASFAGLYKIFEKAGEKGWKALVPFYNFWVWLQLLERPKWWIVFFIIPGVNALMYAILMFQTAYAFGKRTFWHLTFASFFCFFYAHYLGFSKDAKWIGPKDFHNLKKGFIKGWLDPIFFAIVAASIIRTFFLEAFTIPTSSLEKSLLVGDFLFVNKLSYGSRVPMTPLAFPLAHHTIPLLNTKAYLEFWKLPYTRLPGYKTIKNGDIVVFNYPDGDTVALNKQDQSYYNMCRKAGLENLNGSEVISVYYPDEQSVPIGRQIVSANPGFFGKVVGRPIDKREHYVKRCVAIAGDKLEIKDGQVFINDVAMANPEHLQHFYSVKALGGLINKPWLDSMNVNADEQGLMNALGDTDYYKINLEDKVAEKLKTLPGFYSLERENSAKGLFDYNIFPHDPRIPWNNDNFGPLTIPKAGTKIKIDTGNYKLYERIIDVYENNDFNVQGSRIFINGSPATEYTFKQDYYWMMGDNRHNSADSRSWGFVPFDHVVGTPVFVWFSLKYDDKQPISGKWSFKNIFASEQNGKLRWSRFFCFVSDKGLSQSYFIHFLIILGVWIGVSKFLKYRKKKKGATDSSSSA